MEGVNTKATFVGEEDSNKNNTFEEQNPAKILLWHASAGNLVQVPPVNSLVFYFPQGHADHSGVKVDFTTLQYVHPLPLPHRILCVVLSVQCLGDDETDEAFSKVKLKPVGDDYVSDGCEIEVDGGPAVTKFCCKVLSESDTSGASYGFAIPADWETDGFPKSDQTITVTDIRDKVWSFKRRGSKKRARLIGDWNKFVKEKKLVQDDSIIFVEVVEGDMRVGIRCARSTMMIKKQLQNLHVTSQDVLQATTLALEKKPFEVDFYPSTKTPSFFVSSTDVLSSPLNEWTSRERFKMRFESKRGTSDYYTGEISLLGGTGQPVLQDSPWNSIMVTWEPLALQPEVVSVSPWQVEKAAKEDRGIMPAPNPKRREIQSVGDSKADGEERARQIVPTADT